jgi:hypothetical protein
MVGQRRSTRPALVLNAGRPYRQRAQLFSQSSLSHSRVFNVYRHKRLIGNKGVKGPTAPRLRDS